MLRSELAARIAAQNPHLHRWQAEALISAILGRIAVALTDGDRVEIRGFGAFVVRHNHARIGRNPRTGAKVEVGAKTRIQFKPAGSMQAHLNRSGLRTECEAARLQQAS